MGADVGRPAPLRPRPSPYRPPHPRQGRPRHRSGNPARSAGGRLPPGNRPTRPGRGDRLGGSHPGGCTRRRLGRSWRSPTGRSASSRPTTSSPSGCCRRCGSSRLTPGQASVVGYDDTDMAAHPYMSLTSVNQSGTQMGAIAVRLLLERIAGRTESVHEVLTPKVMSRNIHRRTAAARPSSPPAPRLRPPADNPGRPQVVAHRQPGGTKKCPCPRRAARP